MFQDNCSIDTFSSIENVIGYLKNIYEVAAKGETLELDVISILKATLVCKPLIDQCIAPKLQVMKNECTADNYRYAPNLTAVSSWFNRDAPGLFYDDVRHTLTIQVLNNGSAYAWNIKLNVLYGTTNDRKVPVSGGGYLLENENIPELVFFGAQQTGSQTFMGSVKDFLIDQTNFASYLQGQKTDHRLRPFFWEKTIPFTAKPNELTKITMVIDPNQDIDEQNEKDNSYSLIIDNLPTPHRFSIENLKVERVGDSLTKYKAIFDIKNTGEEEGNAIVKWSTLGGALTDGARKVGGKQTIHVERTFDSDVSKSNNSCLHHKDYKVEVWDEDGIHDQGAFEIPAFAGEIYGRIVDLFGKPVVGATVTTNTGATATTQSYGYYHISGINALGPITVTATHPSFSQTETKTAELKFLSTDFTKTCSIKGLTVLGIDFIMKNKSVKWTINLKDVSGRPLNGSVLATNELFRHQVTVEGEKIIEDVQPGEYDVTVSSPGYYTKFLKVTLNPPETETDIVLEKLAGRGNDDGLGLIVPTLLWKKQLGAGGGKIGNLVASKNGKLLVVSVSNNKTKVSTLYFIDPLSGNIKKEVNTSYAIAEERNIGLDTSYDGRTVALFINPGAPGMTDKERILTLFNAGGDKTGTANFNKKSSIFLDVSPDGFYLYPDNLVNLALHKYTRKEIEGIGDGRDPQGYGSFVYFLRSNNLIAICKDGEEGWCERTISDTKVKKIADLDGVPRRIDSTFDDMTHIIRTDKKLYYLGSSVWDKDVKRDNSFVSASISPGGMYTMVAEGSGSDALLTLKIFGNTGGDKTPEFPYKDIRFVSANDKGLFFASVTSDNISYYQIGAYKTDYDAPASLPTSQTAKTNFVTGFFNMVNSFFRKITGLFSGKKK